MYKVHYTGSWFKCPECGEHSMYWCRHCGYTPSSEADTEELSIITPEEKPQKTVPRDNETKPGRWDKPEEMLFWIALVGPMAFCDLDTIWGRAIALLLFPITVLWVAFIGGWVFLAWGLLQIVKGDDLGPGKVKRRPHGYPKQRNQYRALRGNG